MASSEELERRIVALEEKVARLERTLQDPTMPGIAVTPVPLIPAYIGPVPLVHHPAQSCGCSTFYICSLHRSPQ